MRWPLALYRVQGHSMQPTYQPSDTLLGWRGFAPGHLSSRVRPGVVVVAQVGSNLVIKRVGDLAASGAITLLGDNPGDSHDSRQYGGISAEAVQAIIIARLP